MDQSEALRRRADRLDLLTQTTGATPMGRLLRRFWHPIALSDKLAAGKAKLVRVLGEDLTLYRGESGRLYLVGGRCAHRATLLSTGWIEGETIRCIYHGWRYDGAGRCLERPAERDTAPPDRRIAGYPLHEYCGLVFAYLGEGPPPPFELPRKDGFERPGDMLFTRAETWHCNWFQHVENSLDATHVSFVHRAGRVGTFGAMVTAAIPELSYTETDAGIRQVATRSKNNVRASDWTFPNNNHITQPGLTKDDLWMDIGVWHLPIDDEHTTRFLLYAVPRSTEERDSRISAYFAKIRDYNPSDHHRELFEEHKYPDDPLLELTSAQDYLATLGQGIIADRSAEWLGRSDAGIALLRKIFFRELAALEEERSLKQWRRLAGSAHLPPQVPEISDVSR